MAGFIYFLPGFKYVFLHCIVAAVSIIPSFMHFGYSGVHGYSKCGDTFNPSKYYTQHSIVGFCR